VRSKRIETILALIDGVLDEFGGDVAEDAPSASVTATVSRKTATTRAAGPPVRCADRS
jgi:hypothetical protein